MIKTAATALSGLALVIALSACQPDSASQSCATDPQTSDPSACDDTQPPYPGFMPNSYNGGYGSPSPNGAPGGSFGNPGVSGSGGAYSPGSAPVGPAG